MAQISLKYGPNKVIFLDQQLCEFEFLKKKAVNCLEDLFIQSCQI